MLMRFPYVAPKRSAGLSLRIGGGQIRKARILSPLGKPREVLTRFGRWVGVRFDKPVEVGDRIEIELELFDDLDSEAAEVKTHEDWVDEGPEPIEPANDPERDSIALELCKLSDAGADEIQDQGRRYFESLDRATNKLMAYPGTKIPEVIPKLRDALTSRVFARRALHVKPARHDQLASFSDEGVREISSLLLEHLETWFGPLTTAAALSRIGATHDMFAWGGLNLDSDQGIRTPNAAPDSAMIFMFPEFAHLAIERGKQPDIWMTLLPIWTRMPFIYMHLYHQDGVVQWPFSRYALPLPKVDMSERQWASFAASLARDYDGKNKEYLGQVLGKLAAESLTDELVTEPREADRAGLEPAAAPDATTTATSQTQQAA